MIAKLAVGVLRFQFSKEQINTIVLSYHHLKVAVRSMSVLPATEGTRTEWDGGWGRGRGRGVP